MKCSKCKGLLFTIQIIPCCDDCNQNAAYDPETEEYTFDLKTINDKELTRNYVEEEGECRMGSAWGAGCYMFTCQKCNHKMNLPVTDGC